MTIAFLACLLAASLVCNAVLLRYTAQMGTALVKARDLIAKSQSQFEEMRCLAAKATQLNDRLLAAQAKSVGLEWPPEVERVARQN